MKSETVAVLPGPPEPSKINDLECQPTVTAHAEPKGQFGEVSNLLCRLGLHFRSRETDDSEPFDGSYIAHCKCGASWREWAFKR